MFRRFIKISLVFISLFIFQSCSKGLLDGDMSSNMERLDKIYGSCSNPHRSLTKQERLLCEDKDRAAGPGGEVKAPINLTKITGILNGGNSPTIVQGLTINQSLWQASLRLLDQYPIKIVDSQGGFIATDWIIENQNPNQRCSINITILSKELISNGVRVKLICDRKENDGVWYNENIAYINEEKNLTLKLLEIANQIEATQKNS
jgi:hypothetical protein